MSVRVIEGIYKGEGLKFGVVVSRFNVFITQKLLEGALDALRRHGVREEDITVVWVPGAFEIPLVAKKLVKTGKFDGIICLGAVIRGATPHFEYVAAEAAKGVAHVMLEEERTVVIGILTTDTIEKAIESAGTKEGNKGAEAALSALELANLEKQLAQLS